MNNTPNPEKTAGEKSPNKTDGRLVKLAVAALGVVFGDIATSAKKKYLIIGLFIISITHYFIWRWLP